MMEDDSVEVVDNYELTDDDSDDDGIDYASVRSSDLSEDDDDEDFNTAQRSLEAFSKISDTPSKKEPEDSHFVDQKASTVVKPSAIDDFIRNFLLKMGMLKSLDSFNTEWYELQSKKLVDENSLDEVPDIYK